MIRAPHPLGLSLHRAARMSPTFVPYRGSGPLLTGMTAGTVPAMIGTLSAAIGHIRAGL